MPWRAHSRVVSLYAYDLAEALNLPEHMKNLALLAGAVHDIGKRSVPEYILTKPGKLTKAERKLAEQHVIEGENMLVYIAEIVKYHHEKWDGSGYPEKLKGDEIPLLSQIVSVCDTYAAMIADRPYRKALTPEVAIAEIKRCSGTQFDPKVVESFVAMMEKAPEEYKEGHGGAFDNVLDKYPTG